MRTGRASKTGDGELVQQTLAGQANAFTELVNRYRNMAYGTAVHYLGSFDDAQDAAQEAFVQAYLHLKELRDPDRFAPWLRRMTVNQCTAVLRRDHRLLFVEDVEEQVMTCAGGSMQDPTTRILVQQALAQLSEKTRLTILLAYNGGYSHAEIAKFLEIPVATVRSRLQHAKRQLREEMKTMTQDVLRQEQPGPGWTQKVVQESLRRGEEALRKNARGEAIGFFDDALT